MSVVCCHVAYKIRIKGGTLEASFKTKTLFWLFCIHRYINEFQQPYLCNVCMLCFMYKFITGRGLETKWVYIHRGGIKKKKRFPVERCA